MPRYFGLDLHKDYVHGCEWITGVEKGRHFRFPNTPEARQRFVSVDIDQASRVAIEVTGNAFQIHDLLSPVAGQVVMANPVEMKRLGSGRHTDRVDAERLAKMLALGTVPAVWVPPHEIREMRDLVCLREQLVRQRIRSQNEAKGVLGRNGYSLARNSDIRKWLASHSRDIRIGEADLAIAVSIVRMLNCIDEEIRATESEIARRAMSNPKIHLLMSITGVGLIAASLIWARLGDASRFRSPKAVVRYAGLDPSVLQSGEEDRRGHISKNGASDLRRVLVQAFYQVALHDSETLGKFFHRKEKHLGRKRAVIATARILLIVAWAMLLTGEPYRSLKSTRYTQKLKAVRQQAGELHKPHVALDKALCESCSLLTRSRTDHSIQAEAAA
ncbi:MAG: IS110 family transposase [Firmicutes bacterium]|nr:IS110 family transposase [Bacillota bacterium]